MTLPLTVTTPPPQSSSVAPTVPDPSLSTHIELHPLSGQGVEHGGRLSAELLPFEADAALAVVPAVPVGQSEDADSDCVISCHPSDRIRPGRDSLPAMDESERKAQFSSQYEH